MITNSCIIGLLSYLQRVPDAIRDYQMGIYVVENNMKAPQKAKNRTTIWFNYIISGYKLKGNESRLLRDIYNPMFTAALLRIAKKWK